MAKTPTPTATATRRYAKRNTCNLRVMNSWTSKLTADYEKGVSFFVAPPVVDGPVPGLPRAPVGLDAGAYSSASRLSPTRRRHHGGGGCAAFA